MHLRILVHLMHDLHVAYLVDHLYAPQSTEKCDFPLVWREFSTPDYLRLFSRIESLLSEICRLTTRMARSGDGISGSLCRPN